MKRFLISIKHLFVGHEITRHKVFNHYGVYYCPGCDRYFEYYHEDSIGFIEHEISKEDFDKAGYCDDNN